MNMQMWCWLTQLAAVGEQMMAGACGKALFVLEKRGSVHQKPWYWVTMLCRILRGEKKSPLSCYWWMLNVTVRWVVLQTLQVDLWLSVDCVEPKRCYPERTAQGCDVSNNAIALISSLGLSVLHYAHIRANVQHAWCERIFFARLNKPRI